MAQDRILRPRGSSSVEILESRLDHLRQRIAVHVASGLAPALSVVAAQGGEIFFDEAFGTRSPGGENVTTDDPHNIMSITKTVVAVGVMKLVEDGLLTLTRPVGDYLPELATPGNEHLLVHNLLTHTSGFDDEELNRKWFTTALSGEAVDVPDGYDLETHLWLSSSWGIEPVVPLASTMIYANINYLWLGEIIHRVSGQSLDDFTRTQIFEPLGMVNTAFLLRPDQQIRRVRRFGSMPMGPHAFYDTEREDFATSQLGDRSLKSSARDLAILAQMFLNGGIYNGARILSPASVVQICTSHFPKLDFQLGSLVFTDPGYGYGMMMDSGKRMRYFNGVLQPQGSCGHSGAGGSHLYFDPKNDLSIVVLELVTHMSPDSEPISGLYPVICDMIYASLTTFQP
ncbi:MAG: serine hydrolase domain-containing protein [Actinomycetota bacterium]